MMFYNGFNLLIDLILAGVVFFFSYRAGWFRGYSEGQADAVCDDCERMHKLEAEYAYDSWIDSRIEEDLEAKHGY